MKKRILIISVFLVCLIVPLSLLIAKGVAVGEKVAIRAANTLTDNQRALQGIKEVSVVVVLSDDAVKAGLLKRQVQTDVELKLRRNGIKVLSQTEYGPILQINAIASAIQSDDKQNTFGYYCSVDFALNEYVQIIRNDEIVLAATWNLIGSLHASPDMFSKYTREHMSGTLDIFLNDYFAANPKEPPARGKVKGRDIFDQIEESTKP